MLGLNVLLRDWITQNLSQDESERMNNDSSRSPKMEWKDSKVNQGQEELVLSKTERIYPTAEGYRFGMPVISLASVSLLEQHHYSGDWDVMRPAKEIKGMNILTTEDLIRLKVEAESIIERWVA